MPIGNQELKHTFRKTKLKRPIIFEIPGAFSGWKPPTGPDDWKPANARANDRESDVPFNKSTIQMVRLVQLSFATQMQNQKEIQKSASES